MKIKEYYNYIYNDYLKEDWQIYTLFGKIFIYPFWILKIIYYYIFFLFLYPFAYLIFTNVNQYHIDKLHFYQNYIYQQIENINRINNESNND